MHRGGKSPRKVLVFGSSARDSTRRPLWAFLRTLDISNPFPHLKNCQCLYKRPLLVMMWFTTYDAWGAVLSASKLFRCSTLQYIDIFLDMPNPYKHTYFPISKPNRQNWSRRHSDGKGIPFLAKPCEFPYDTACLRAHSTFIHMWKSSLLSTYRKANPISFTKDPLDITNLSYGNRMGTCDPSASEFTLAASLTTWIPTWLIKQHGKLCADKTLEMAGNLSCTFHVFRIYISFLKKSNLYCKG